MLGPAGSVIVFGPQRGVDEETIRQMEANLDRSADRLREAKDVDPYRERTGAAGGTAFGLSAWGATLVSGAEAMASVVGLTNQLADADVVITGEGAFDSQTAAAR